MVFPNVLRTCSVRAPYVLRAFVRFAYFATNTEVSMQLERIPHALAYCLQVSQGLLHFVKRENPPGLP